MNMEITVEILKSLNRQGTEVVKRGRIGCPEVLLEELIWSILEFGTTTEAAEYLSISRSTISRVLKTTFNLSNAHKTRDWRVWLVTQTPYKKCSICNNYLDKEQFHFSKDQIDKSKSSCKDCSNAKSRNHYANNTEYYKIIHKNHYENNKSQYIAKDAKRRAAKLQRTVSWANLAVIKTIYLNCPKGYHVDHIVPLQGKTVSGLHVENNLQYLTSEENIKKGNKY